MTWMKVDEEKQKGSSKDKVKHIKSNSDHLSVTKMMYVDELELQQIKSECSKEAIQ